MVRVVIIRIFPLLPPIFNIWIFKNLPSKFARKGGESNYVHGRSNDVQPTTLDRRFVFVAQLGVLQERNKSVID